MMKNKTLLIVCIVVAVVIAAVAIVAITGNQGPQPTVPTVPTTQGNAPTQGDPPTDPAPTEPNPTDPAPTEPNPTDPTPTEPPHQHEYAEEVVEATCTEGGYTTYTCSCGDTYQGGETEAKGHAWGEWEVTLEATETTPGSQKRICTACSAEEIEEIPVAGHVHNYTAAVVEPTCTEQGYTLYACGCGDSYKENYTEPMGHAYVKQVVKPTCLEEGYTTFVCSDCEDSYVGDYVDAKGHAFVETTTAVTCTASGYVNHTCSDCGYSYKDGYQNALGHDYGDWETVKEATCGEAGEKKRACSRCQDCQSEEIAQLEHAFGETVVTEPTCTEQGNTTRTCQYCGNVAVDTKEAALGHDWGDWSVVAEATCTEPGEEKRSCSRCGTSEAREIEALDHVYGEGERTEPSCTVAGAVVRTCTVCGHVSSTVTSPSLGHDYETVIQAATCTDAGSITKTCKVCREKTTNEIEALGHDWTEWVPTKAATTSEAGEKTRECKNCGETETEVIPKLEGTHKHTAVKTEVAATCTENGYTLYVCSGCGFTNKSTTTYAKGHSWSNWETTVEPTTSAPGEEQRICNTCGEVQTIGIPALDSETGAPYESYIDPAIEIKEWADCVAYKFDETDVSVSDFRSWGDAPSIWVNEDGTLKVVYYNQNGERVEFIVELPPEGYVNRAVLKEDGTYQLSLVGGFGG